MAVVSRISLDAASSSTTMISRKAVIGWPSVPRASAALVADTHRSFTHVDGRLLGFVKSIRPLRQASNRTPRSCESGESRGIVPVNRRQQLVIETDLLAFAPR